MVFQHNPQTGDRRISGTCASLAGLEAALDAGDDAAVSTAIDRILLAHTIAIGWGGVPVLWMGDEVGLRNDLGWADDPDHADDNRWIHRPRMPWDVAVGTAGHGRAVRLRRSLVPARRAGRTRPPARVGAVRTARPDRPGVLAVVRRHPLGPLLALYNVTDTERPFPAWRLHDVGLEPALVVDTLTGAPPPADEHGNVRLAAYAAMWLIAS